ncbi:MAG TPA: hypothetical protein ACFYD6_13560 [Candidatus Brocadiia bacterium]|nr:hypothetical protein [Candidatus Brocadiales bacterium]
MENFTLGLDIGTNSVGWAIVECDDNKKPTRLIDLNARIFQEMVEGPEYKRVPKNKNRREKRGARRLTSRYKERRTKLVKLLIENECFQRAWRIWKIGKKPLIVSESLFHSGQRVLTSRSLRISLGGY